MTVIWACRLAPPPSEQALRVLAMLLTFLLVVPLALPPVPLVAVALALP